jgi:cyclophilin family peptidyl-prolyl cis-trans isomerase
MKTIACALLVSLGVACSDGGGSADDDDDAPAADADPNAPDAPALSGPNVVLVTSMGTMVVRLAEDEMPITTGNFLDYVDSGFYDDTLVHRVIDDWVIQGGGFASGMVPKSTNPPIVLETSPNIGHVHGAISMARTTDPNSATSQWFIVDWPESGTPPQPAQLDGQYAAFGLLIEGFDVLETIATVETSSSDVPVTEVVVISASRQ